MPAPIVHFQITTADPDRTIQFLRDVFDWEAGPGAGNLAASLDTGASQVVPNDIFVGGSVRQAPAGALPGTTIFVRVANLDGTLAKAVDHGGTVLVPRTDRPGTATVALIRTPDGMAIGLVQL